MKTILEFKHQEDDVMISLVDMAMAQSIFKLVQDNRDMLSEWLPWAKSMKTIEDERAFIEFAQLEYEKKNLMACVIVVNGMIAGMIDLHNIDLKNLVAEIGYWLSTDFQHRGLMHVCVDKLCRYSFNQMGLKEIKLLARPGNQASRNVAKRCHFVLKAEIPVVRKIGDYDHDFVIYSRKSDLKADYR
ncbi:GNAT family N-acetyltransferase [Apilactobacillus apinorum]|uniref:GNAT family protein n=1 Tax=Apilactobacillus apinorum TaxID=1218495 RepID=A0ABP9ZHP9_9LACO